MIQAVSKRLVLLSLLLGTACQPNAQINLYLPVLTQHNNDRRSGVQLETQLKASNVNTTTFGKLFTIALPNGPHSRPALLHDRIYTQPLVVDKPNPMVIVATDTNMVYAFDALNASAQPVWQADLGPPESPMDTWADAHCNRSLPVVGVLGTPVITPDEKTLYVVSKNVDANSPSKAKTSFTIHAIDVANGHEIHTRKLTVPGGGFNEDFQLQRPALAWVLSDKSPHGGGYVYAALGGHCDAGTYHGWVFGFDGDLNQVESFNATPGGSGGGIWQAGQAPVVDYEQCPNACTGVLYVATGNATGNHPELATGADSVMRFSVHDDGKLAVLNAFRPYNAASIDACDADLAATGTVLLDTGGGRLVASGKQGVMYVLKTSKLGHGTAADAVDTATCFVNGGGGGFRTSYNWIANGDSGAVIQEFEAVTPFNNMQGNSFGHVHGTPVYLDLNGGLRLYVWPEMDHLKQFVWSAGKFNTTPEHQSTGVAVVDGMPGGMLSISSTGNNDGIVWATHPKADDAWAPPPAQVSSQPAVPQSVPKPVAGMLFAFDALDVTKPLWTSDMRAGGKDSVGEFAKFASPSIWNGHVYVPTFSGQIQVYGLCGTPSKCT